jgi:hypothetical protein
MLGAIQIIRELNYQKFELPYELPFDWGIGRLIPK